MTCVQLGCVAGVVSLALWGASACNGGSDWDDQAGEHADPVIAGAGTGCGSAPGSGFDAGGLPVPDAGTGSGSAADAGTLPVPDAGTGSGSSADAGTLPVPDAGTGPGSDAGTLPIPDAGTGPGSDAGACAPAPGDTTYAATPTIDATSKSSVAKGPYTRGAEMLETSAAALRTATAHAKTYDGATQFTAAYSIVVDNKGVLDKTKSTITMTTVNYTSSGTVTPSTFKTNALKVTAVTLTMDCPPKLKTITFASDDWYPATGTGSAGLKDRTLTGSLDVAAGTATYSAKYASKSTGAIYTYDVSGKVAVPKLRAEPGLAPRTAGDVFAPPVPDPELADAGTSCDNSNECDQPDGLSCLTGTCR